MVSHRQIKWIEKMKLLSRSQLDTARILMGGCLLMLSRLYFKGNLFWLVSEGQTLKLYWVKRKEKSILHIYLYINNVCSQLEKNTQTIVAESNMLNIYFEIKYWIGISRASLGSGTKGFFPFLSFSGEILISSGLPTPASAVFGALLIPLQDFWWT